ncbi:MAG: hypothetical protein HWE12_13100 [Oceanospirillaceae bacterium]|nr:hypothetical protein [Oceanospirillaceae bacterium]
MVALYRLSVALMMLCSLIAKAAELNVVSENSEPELGKALNAKIIYQGAGAVAQANLQRWQGDFFIDRRRLETEQLADGAVRTTETLRLFPRRSGSLTLYSLALGGAISEPVEVSVMPALRNGIDGTPEWQKLPQQVWQGETFTNCVHMAMFDARNNMKLETPDFRSFRVVALEEQRESSATVEKTHQCWKLTALETGPQQLELPPVIQRGRGQWTFYLPLQSVEVLPLPSYLPPGVAIGKPDLAVEQDGDNWRVSLYLNDNLAAEAYGLRASIASVSGIATDQVEVQVSSEANTGRSYQLFSAPLPTWLWGFGKAQRLALRYFDTEAGMLRTLEVDLPKLWRTPGWFMALLAFLFLLIALPIGLKVRKAMRDWREQQRFRRAVKQASTAEQLRQTLLKQGSSKTLHHWAERSGLKNADSIAKDINTLCFSQKPLSPKQTHLLEQVKAALLG